MIYHFNEKSSVYEAILRFCLENDGCNIYSDIGFAVGISFSDFEIEQEIEYLLANTWVNTFPRYIKLNSVTTHTKFLLKFGKDVLADTAYDN